MSLKVLTFRDIEKRKRYEILSDKGMVLWQKRLKKVGKRY